MSTTTRSSKSSTPTRVRSILPLLWLVAWCVWLVDLSAFISPLSPVDSTYYPHTDQCAVTATFDNLDVQPKFGGYEGSDATSIAPCAVHIPGVSDLVYTGDPGGF